MISNVEQLLANWDADSIEKLGQYVFDGTDCGAWVEVKDDGVQYGSIIEGCDFEVIGNFLPFPFTTQQQQQVIDDIEVLCAVQWARSNRECIVCHELIDSEEADQLDALGEDWTPVCSSKCATDFYFDDEYKRYNQDVQHASFSW